MSDINITIEKRKFIQDYAIISSFKEDSYVELTYELGGTNNYSPSVSESIEKKISSSEYNKIINPLLTLNYSEILKENEFIAALDGYTISVELSIYSTKIRFEVIQQSIEKAKPETKKLLEVCNKVFNIFEKN